jgi:hypothetical protein
VGREARQELEATLAARRELGPAHDAELVAGFVDRIEREIDRRVDERVAKRVHRASPLNPPTLGVCIPIIAIAGGLGGVAGLIAAFVALVVVFGLAELRR